VAVEVAAAVIVAAEREAMAVAGASIAGRKNSKHQAPNPKETSISKLQTPIRVWGFLLLLQLQEIAQDLPSIFGENTLGMKLHAPNGELFVFHAHDFAFLSLGCNLQTLG